MRATKWNLNEAEKRLKATLEWRREYKPDLIPPDEVKMESETGKMYALRSIWYLLEVQFDFTEL
jgi:exonuclease III